MAKKRIISRKNLIIVMIVVVIVTVAGLVYWQFNQSARDDAGNREDSLDQSGDVALVDEINKLRGEERYAEAQELIESQSDYSDGSFTTILYAQTLADKGDIGAALEVLSKAEEGRDNKYWYRGHAANILSSANRTSEALVYYKAALDLAKKYNPTNDEESLHVITAIGDYEYYIQQIEEGSDG